MNVNLSALTEVLDPQFYGEKWVAITRRARIIAYNNNNPRPNISTYQDLTNEEFAKKVLVRSATSSYNIALLSAMIQTDGTQQAQSWVEGVVNNFARIPTGNDRDQARAVVSGLGELAIMNTYYLILMENSSDPADRAVASSIGVILPENTHMNISYVAMINQAANAKNAQKFIDYLLAIEQQTLFMNENGEFPVRNDVTLNSTIQSWGDFSVAPINYETLGKDYAQAVILFDLAGWK